MNDNYTNTMNEDYDNSTNATTKTANKRNAVTKATHEMCLMKGKARTAPVETVKQMNAPGGGRRRYYGETHQ